MKVMIDGVDTSVESVEKSQIIDEVVSVLSAQNRVVMSVSVDDNEMDMDAFRSLEGGQVADFCSMGIEDLVSDNIKSASDYLPGLSKGFERVADLLEEEKTEEAMALALQVMEGLEWLLSSIDRCFTLLGCGEKEKQVKAFSDARGVLESKLGDMVTSFEGGKLFQPALVLREDFPPQIEVLRLSLTYLSKLVSGKKH